MANARLAQSGPAGWTRDKPTGKQWNMGVSMSMAEADYEKGDSRITLGITDTAFNQLMLAPLSFMLKSGWSERSTNGYKKAVAGTWRASTSRDRSCRP